MNKFLNFKINKTAINKINSIITKHKKKLRIFIKGGGCGGIKYNFILTNIKKKNDICIIKKNITIVIDPISFQYLNGSYLFYYYYLEEAKFIIKNSNIKTTCNCGSSINFKNF
ncbi:iron-sulfur cluster assembly accessory protein [Enterobacteriaceae bacterium ET-AT1-13]|nr:iron-sulfur cluster assembly accessory protein [Enterobacteriaceae bacterium ET-AT1-13]WGS66447.1 iron-sulfur cluster assembly accessory protein [Enterobacteriaceae bacterium Cmel17]WMC17472.1 MAG: iron-sulfur cluster assembly accessory protein [Enterobacteriaceae bacterium Cmel21]WMC17679.1 MAG: iron-sulfur cluster assembly accessory protein [Enterobacteriaceae bacterium PSmelAO3-2]WMC17883.1 MAG: iron-sulfur cluster assembly accessory protein [Enterobacteriaceae bacterium PSmelAO3-1]WMC18